MAKLFRVSLSSCRHYSPAVEVETSGGGWLGLKHSGGEEASVGVEEGVGAVHRYNAFGREVRGEVRVMMRRRDEMVSRLGGTWCGWLKIAYGDVFDFPG